MVSPYHHPLRSSTGASKCAKSHLELPDRDDAPSLEGPKLEGPLSWLFLLKKLKPRPICPKTHKGPAPWWGLPLLKMASPYHHTLRSSTGASKCAKLCLELLAVHHPCESGGAGLLSSLAWVNVPYHSQSHWPLLRHILSRARLEGPLTWLSLKNWIWANLFRTHRGPAPWWELSPLKTSIPYNHPPWSSAGVSKCAKSHPELLAINEAPFFCCFYWMTKIFVAFDLPNVTIPLTTLTE